MNKNNFFICVGLLLLLFGCEQHCDYIDDDNQINRNITVSKTITQEEALDMASKVLKRAHITRSISVDSPMFEYVLNNNKTRASKSVLPDTLAYVINYPNNDGFVIISTIRNVYPVLAFSDKGNFTFENENVKYNFIDKLGAYIGNADTTKMYSVDDSDFATCYVVNPAVKTCLDQRSPWDKYVIKEHPGCPVGCVAVATALVLSYSTPELMYHGSTFYFKSIMEAINQKQDSEDADLDYSDINQLYDDWDDIHQPVYSYEQAVDSMAKFLYWIGKDVGMKYQPNGSGAKSSKANELCDNLVGTINSGSSNFDVRDIVCFLKDNYVVYLEGRDEVNLKAHAWVADGCQFCVNKDFNQKPSIVLPSINNSDKINKEDVEPELTFVHCDWGWGGYCNGYYSGAVFNVANMNFKPTYYFAAKRTHKK